MAQPWNCDSDQHEPRPGVVTVQLVESADVQVYCGPCLADFCWGMVEGLPDYDAQIDLRIAAKLSERDAAKPKAARRRVSKSAGEGEGKDTADLERPSESTPDTE